MSDLQEAITHNRSASDLPHHDRCDLGMALVNLGVYLRRRFVHFDASADLDEAIAFCRSGLNFYPKCHSKRLSSLQELDDDWNRAIALARGALQLRPQDTL